MSVNVNGNSNYISDGELMLWLAEQQDKIYGDLRDAMQMSETRSAATSALADIKLHLEQANESGNFTAVDQELQAFMAEYGQYPELQELTATVGEIAASVHERWADTVSGYSVYLATEASRHAQAQSLVDASASASALLSGEPLPEPGSAAQLEPEPPRPISMPPYDDNTLKSWFNAIDSKIDGSNKNDQLTMIHIQELKATLDQGTQLGSTLIAGTDRALQAVIGNIA